MHSIIRLKNGLKLIHKENPSPISHFGVLVNAGTRDERPDKMGLAHFVEHTIFKGTEKRKAYQINKRLEDVGGELSASTSKEETYFHASFLSQDYERALELLSDIFFHATFPEKELEKEKQVIAEEIEYYNDTPSELIFDDFETLFFAGHPLAANILGNKKSLRHLHRCDILDFIKQQYGIGTIVLASVGQIGLKKLVALCERYFGQEPVTEITRVRTPFTHFVPTQKRVKKEITQTQLMVGTLAYSLQEEEKKNAFALLNNLLGGQGMNTRLYREIREKHGWAYSVESNYSSFSDCGLFTVYVGCDHERSEACVEAIFKELDKLKRDRLGTMQLHYAKKQFIGQTAIANETKLNEMLTIGRTALFSDEVNTMEEYFASIDRLTSDDLLTVANEIFDREKFSQLTFEKRG